MTISSDQLTALLPLAAPALAFALVALAAWLARRPSEVLIARLVSLGFTLASLSAVTTVVLMVLHRDAEVRVPLGAWFSTGHYSFEWELVFDRLSAPFSVVGAFLVGLVAAFSRTYLHREPGYGRFYLLLCLFGAGVQLVVLGGGLDLLLIGWELVGISSALLIAFFHERQGPVRHGLRAFLIYRTCDVGLLGATVWLHHSIGNTRFVHAAEAWTCIATPSRPADLLVVGFLLLWATLGKSAQVPLGGWLPRAMEGPTPSSAIFYGALSVHLGAYLLLRSAAILDATPVVAATVIAVGAATALHGTFVGRVQTDIKSALAYSVMTQVGVIFVEIGAGLRVVALAHIVGHACLRTLQILRSPSLLHDHHDLERAVGSHLPRTGGHLERWVPAALQPWLYRHALERGYFDALLRDHVVGGFVRTMRAIDRLEERWVALLSGAQRPSAPWLGPALSLPPLAGTAPQRSASDPGLDAPTSLSAATRAGGASNTEPSKAAGLMP